jgi:C4-dicarboxylate transporter DctQ subunit
MRVSSLLRNLARLEHCWNRVEQVTVGVLGLAALGFGIVQVVGRYVAPHQAIAYAEELIVYLVVWAIMISSSQLVRRDGHVRSDIVVRLLSSEQQRWLEVFNCLVALAFVLGLWWYGQQIVETALLLDERSSSDLQFPKWVYYAALPSAGVLMTVRYLIRLLKFLFFYDSKTMMIGHIPAHEAGLLSPEGDVEMART